MPFADATSNVSGRNSRASNVSGMTSNSHAASAVPPDALSNAGVLSMLKTSTDTGDIGALSFNHSRLPMMPRATHQRRNHTSKPSGSDYVPSGGPSHLRHAPSQASKVSSQWDSASHHRRGSFTSMQSMPSALPPAHTGQPSMPRHDARFDDHPDSRSYSMTSAPAYPLLPKQRSQSSSSLKSQGHEPRQRPRMHADPVPPLPEHRPQFIYPTRLKRPGFRSPSPALSDTYAQAPHVSASHMQRWHHTPRPPMLTAYDRSYTADFADEYDPGPIRPIPRHQARITQNSGIDQGYDMGPYIRRPGHGRQAPPLRMPYGMPQSMRVYAQRQPSRPMNLTNPYAERPAYSYLAPMQYAHQSDIHAPSDHLDAGPVKHRMQYASRRIRYVPQRPGTPMTDMGLESNPPSSDPPSSSSNPPTPRGVATMARAAVDPALIEPALADLADSPSQSILPAKYFEYAEGLHKLPDDTDMEVPHPSVPPSGFVQRVRAMLESKAAKEAAAQLARIKSPPHPEIHELEAGPSHENISGLLEAYELPANETPRFTVIEEFTAPAELPASSVKIPELEVIEPTLVQTSQRITREAIRAELGTESSVDTAHEQRSSSRVDVQKDTDLQGTATGRRDGPECSKAAEVFEDGAVAAHADSRRDSARDCHASATCLSVDATLPSGAGYALRFTSPADTTAASEETQSENPFILDADTITTERRAQDAAAELKKTDESKRPASLDPSTALGAMKDPVSPLRPGEDVSRTSAVSPMHTLGIDETLQLAPYSRSDRQVERDISAPGSLPDGREVTSTSVPRAVDAYSKPAGLQPRITEFETNSTNRLSLPGELSTIGDSTLSTGSDIVTDVAVRFSLPRNRRTSIQAHTVDDPISNTEKSKLALASSKAPIAGHPGTHGCTAISNEILPLNINKKADSCSQVRSNNIFAKGAISGISKPAARALSDVSKGSYDGTADIHLPGPVPSNPKTSCSAAKHLPGLKEESTEDMSTLSQKRLFEDAQICLSARISGAKTTQERRLLDKGRALNAARQHNRPLADTKDLPSLNFSQMDLIDKLNQALDVRQVRSMDEQRRRSFSTIFCPSPQRPRSTEPLRERYKSFFSKPEDFSFFGDADDGSVKDADDDGPETDHNVPVVQVLEETQAENAGSEQYAPSPDDFLSFASQVNRLSIPSVAGLSEKLSELIPGLKNLSSFQFDSLFAPDQESHGFAVNGKRTRPGTVFSNRSSGFRALVERAEEIVKNGTHDSIRPFSQSGSSVDKALPPLPESASCDLIAKSSSIGNHAHLSVSVSAPTDLGKELPCPPNALLRSRSPTTEEEVFKLLPQAVNPITRNAKYSGVTSPSSSRPWNLDGNYPWADKKVAIDLSVPPEAHARISTNETLRERKSKSLSVPNSECPTETSLDLGIDIGSITSHGKDKDDNASITTEQATGVSNSHARKQSKRSLIGSFTRKLGLSSRSTAGDSGTIKTLPRSPPPRFSSSDLAHKPGDRYPTSALTPPAGFNLDEVRSFFSDDSSERERTTSLRKRLTTFKGKGRSGRLDPLRSGPSLDGANTVCDNGSTNRALCRNMESSADTYPGIDIGVGMGKTEFHLKRFGEKLRHLLAKSHDLIRSFSARGRSRSRRHEDDWLADSLYSGA